VSRITLDGFEAFVRMTKRAQQEVPEVARQALSDLMRKVLDRSQELCPVSDPEGPRSRHHGGTVPSGFLKESALLEIRGDEASGTAHAVLGYWAEYAVYVHEDGTKNHEPPTQWKFLEVAVTELMPRMPQYLAEIWYDWFRHWTAGAFYGAVGTNREGVRQWAMPSPEYGTAPHGLGNTPP
jgi:hypothetical protein